MAFFLFFNILTSCTHRVYRTIGNVKDRHSQDILEAVRRFDLPMVKSLLDSRPGLVNAKDSAGYTPLHWAAVDGCGDVVLLLISRGADVNAKNNAGFTPLHNAARSGHEKVIKSLISRGANINARSMNGITPLKLAVDAGHEEVAEFLRSCGARM